VLKINSLKYLLVFSFFDHFLMTSSKYKLNKTGDSGQPCLTPWVITPESSDIQLPALILIMFSIYIVWIIVIKCVGIPLLDITVHNLSLSSESKAFLKSINAIYGGMLNSLCFSIICEAENVQSMQGLPFPKSFLLF